MGRFQALAQNIGGTIADRNISEVIFYLQDMKNNFTNQLGAIFVMSQLVVVHESVSTEIVEVLINDVAQDIMPENQSIIEASMICLKNISGKILSLNLEKILLESANI